MTAAELRDAVDSGLAHVSRQELNTLPSTVSDPIRYSIDGGGKRLRGMLLIAAYRAAGGTRDASGLAAAVELLHAYSLIHDDLPCMDDDDIRRGRPTAHRVFGVPATTVAGASMIPLAARIAYDSAVALVLPRETACTIVKVLMRAAGAGGMIGGQLADLSAEGADLSREELDLIHSAKTGALIAASLEIGGLAAAVAPSKVRALADFGSRIGLAFQIMDDVLDVTSSTDMLGKTTGRDAALKKSTYPALLGVEGATARASDLVASACEELRSNDILSPELEELATFIVSRSH